jgi:dTDP-4-amino-4,6-dideoxygalactose transaminase
MKVMFSPPDVGEQEITEVAEALRSGWITTGPRTKELERQLAALCNTKKSVCLNSATTALELILRVAGVGPGDEVIVPAYTYTASASVVVHVGATLVMVDCAKDSFEMDYDRMEAAITERTKVVIPVDLGGVMCDYDRIYAALERKKALFCPKNDLQRSVGRVLVASDGAHALGAEWHGKMCGEVADFTSFSFHAVKNFTTAEGGALTWNISGIDDEALYKEFQLMSLHGQSKDALAKTQLGAWEYDVVYPAYKGNMTDIMAAMGLVQIKRYPGMMERRHAIIHKYNEALKVLNVQTLNHEDEHHCSSGHLYLVRLLDATSEQRNEVIIEMAKREIACNVHYKPLPMMTAYKALGMDIKDFPNAFEMYHNEVTLPLHTCLTNEQVDFVITNFIDIIKKILN